MTKKLSALAPVLLATALTLPSGCNIRNFDGYVFDYKGAKSQQTTSGQIDEAVKTISVENKFGNVDIATTEGPSDWTWEGQVWAKTQSDADELGPNLKMAVSVEGDKQSWKVTLPDRKQQLRGVKSNLTIRVPAQVSVVIVNEHGDVAVQGVSDSTKIDNEHGNIKTVGLAGTIDIKNRHGEIDGNEFSGPANIDCEHGDIKIDGSSEALSIVCEHGDVKIRNSSADVSMTTEHGNATIQSSGAIVSIDSEHCDVKLTMNNEMFRSININAEHSNVEVSLPSSAHPRVEMTADHGNVKSDFQSSEEKDSPQIRIDTEHGDIKIRKI